jgi:biotin synthase
VIALAKLITRNTNIPATTTVAIMHPQGGSLSLTAGANVVMPDFTPAAYKSRYDIYPGRADVGSAQELLELLATDFKSIGRMIGKSAENRQPKSLQKTPP